MYLKIIPILFIMGCTSSSVKDLSEVEIGSEAISVIESLTIANSYPTDEEENTWNYFVDLDASLVSYGNVIFDKDVELGVKDNLLQGYKGVSEKTNKSDDLLNELIANYGKGKLISSNSDKHHVYVWKKGDIIIHYLMGVSMISEDENEEISGSLTIVNQKALEKGLWPYSKGLLNAINQPDLRE